MEVGNIYKITNKISGKVYVGQTVRDIQTRFNEHCFDNRSTSDIHKAIKEEGWQNFKLELIEQVPYDEMDEKEIYWIKYYNSREEGYNKSSGGKYSFDNYWNQILVEENKLIFNSLEDMSRIISSLTCWKDGFIKSKIRESIDTGNAFLGHHYKKVVSDSISSIDDIENWVKGLSVKYNGKHVHCKELNMEFDAISGFIDYVLNNNLYIGKSKCPIQDLYSLVRRNIEGKSECVSQLKENLTVEYVPGKFTKNPGSDKVAQCEKTRCVELNMDFDSQIEAAKYMIDNNLWTGIKLKTARMRISEMCLGHFDSFKGYKFVKVTQT